MTAIKDKLKNAKSIHMLNRAPINYSNGMQSTTPLLDMATQELLKALNDIKENASDFELFTNTMVNGEKGIKLLEINAMQICLLATGDIADTPAPFDRNSVLTKREPEYISERYGAEKCLDHLHKTMDRIVDHVIQVYNDNREAVKADPLSPDRILKMVGPSN